MVKGARGLKLEDSAIAANRSRIDETVKRCDGFTWRQPSRKGIRNIVSEIIHLGSDYKQ